MRFSTLTAALFAALNTVSAVNLEGRARTFQAKLEHY
jgi:hypothetical protein